MTMGIHVPIKIYLTWSNIYFMQRLYLLPTQPTYKGIHKRGGAKPPPFVHILPMLQIMLYMMLLAVGCWLLLQLLLVLLLLLLVLLLLLQLLLVLLLQLLLLAL